MAYNNGLGPRSEEAAARFLERKGFAILGRNFRTPRGEIDIVAMEGPVIVFVEVKSRTSRRFGDPSLAVDHRKQLRLRRAASDYLRTLKGRWPPCRFDVVSVQSDSGRLTIQHLVDAF